jgi:LEA14-like dessication related protein
MNKLLFLFIIFIIYSCSKIQAPVYKSISDLKAIRTGSNIFLNGNVLLYNPNKTKLILKNAQIDVFLNDQILSQINKKFDLELLPEQDFRVPVDVTIAQDRIKTLIQNYTLQLLTGKKLNLHCNGTIKVKAYHVSIRVRINEEIPININDLF